MAKQRHLDLALRNAVCCGSEERVRALLAKGADACSGSVGATAMEEALLRAKSSGDLGMARILLMAEAGHARRRSWGALAANALMMAIGAGALDCVRALARGADPLWLDAKGRDAFDWAIGAKPSGAGAAAAVFQALADGFGDRLEAARWADAARRAQAMADPRPAAIALLAASVIEERSQLASCAPEPEGRAAPKRPGWM